jgi:DNA-binding response OmpR family regulator
MRVLVVDDVAVIADLLARRLRAQGFTALWATSMSEVERLLGAEEFEFDAIVADWDLGKNEPSGIDLRRFAHQKCPSARRILVSGNAVEIDPADVIEAFLRKPIRDSDLVKALCAPPRLFPSFWLSIAPCRRVPTCRRCPVLRGGCHRS